MQVAFASRVVRRLQASWQTPMPTQWEFQIKVYTNIDFDERMRVVRYMVIGICIVFGCNVVVEPKATISSSMTGISSSKE